ncbi:MAG: hypothetical protein FJX72_01000, partial [Armatimonadetes bacterium]|nr:hypothetical protein [Armatimonadota bacterium]
MRNLAAVVGVVCLVLGACRADIAITNGGFETLGDGYFPADWSAVGPGVAVSTECRTGRHALRLNRSAANPMPPETGLNRGWTPNAGRGAMLDCTRGILHAWFRLRSASPDASVALVVIPMGEPGFENTGEMRAMRTIPGDLAGDGLWHEAKLAFDYSKNAAVKWVHVGVRMTGGPADLLVDDFSLADGDEPILQFEKVRVTPDRAHPESRAVLSAMVSNSGSAASGAISLTVHGRVGLTIEGPVAIEPLAAGDARIVTWDLRGSIVASSLTLAANEASGRIARPVRLEPRLELVSALAQPSIVAPGAQATVTATVWNRGSAVSAPTTVVLDAAKGGALPISQSRAIPALAPGRRTVVRFAVRVGRPQQAAALRCRLGETAWPISLVVTDAVRATPKPLVAGLALRRGSDRPIVDVAVPMCPTAARMPHLGRVTVRLPNGSVETITARYGGTKRTKAGAVLRAVHRDRSGGAWTFDAAFSRLRVRGTGTHGTEKKRASAAWRCVISASCSERRTVLLFEGPCLLAGEGGTGSAKREAIFPGLEWLVDDEVSSGDLDIVASHADRPRYAPHPNKVTIPAMSVSGPAGTVALLWDARDRWDGHNDRPQPLFASPDRLAGSASHRMALIAPNAVVTGGEGGGWTGLTTADGLGTAPAARLRYVLPAKRVLRLAAVIYAGAPSSGAMDGIEEWFAWHKPAPPAPCPRGSDGAQIAWSMKAYMTTLWDSAKTGWFTYLSGPAIWRTPSMNPGFAYDLLQAIRTAPQHPETGAWRAKLTEAGFLTDKPRVATADDLQLSEGDPIMALHSLGLNASGIMAAQEPDGAFRFEANRRDTGVFVGYDYNELGEDGAVEVGLIAGKARQLLYAARLSGDRTAYEAGLRSLQRMEEFSVPRAAQVWEVPVHTPDILAAADAVDAYLEAYWFSGQARWLDRAKLWARRGLPFVYVWNEPGKLWMRYGSIPVFGASLNRYSWFGNVVQWNGLRYALALLKLHPHDPSVRWGGLSWRDIAIGITRSAMYQQSPKAEILATWPDSLHTITGARASWDFAPRQILKNTQWWLGRPEEPTTVRVKTTGAATIRISS